MISTHVLDTSTGRPISGVGACLFLADEQVGSGTTDADGRIRDLPVLGQGTYRIVFAIGDHFPDGFYPDVSISFRVRDETAHYHVPLLISPFGYTTYRGS